MVQLLLLACHATVLGQQFFLVVPFLSTNSTKTTSSAYELESPAGNRFEMLYDNGLDLEEQISICSNILISLANFR